MPDLQSNFNSPQRFAVLLSYIGTHYCGWQKQAGTDPGSRSKPSIQETMESTLEKITSEKTSCLASGRTDSGVHALGQVAHFTLRKKPWDPHTLLQALNSLLPLEIRILKLRVVEESFHSQKSAQKKQYSYYFQEGSCAHPFYQPYTHWTRVPLDIEKMKLACRDIIGEHDFLPFRASGAAVGSTVRTIFEAEVSREFARPLGVEEVDFGLLRFRVVGSGFLKQMVRGIAGTLMEVGLGRRDPGSFREILQTGERKRIGKTAAAKGLWLEKVWYLDPNFL